MADLYYYETGYIDEKYHVYTADAIIGMGPYIVEGYIEDGYYVDYSAQSSLTCDAEIVVGVTVEANGTWSSAAGISATAERIQQAAAAISSEFAQSTNEDRYRGLSSSLTSEFTQSSQAGRIQQAAADFGGLFSPSIGVEVFKNHTAVIEAVVSMNTDASANRSANVLLEHIADLNAMAAKTAVFDSSMATEFTQSTQATKSVTVAASLETSTTLFCEALNVQLASANISVTSALYANRYVGSSRSLDLINGSASYNSSIKKFGTASLSSSINTTTIPKFSVIPKGTNDFYYDGWFYSTTANQSVNIFQIYQFLLITLTGGALRIRMYIDDPGPGDVIPFYDHTESTDVALNTWNHWAVVNTGNTLSYYLNGTRIYTITESPMPFYSWGSVDGSLSFVGLSGSSTLLVDEVFGSNSSNLGYNAAATTITVPAAARSNDPTTTAFLYHVDGTILDDIYVTHSAQATMATVAAITALANANTKQGLGNLAVASTIIAEATKAVETAATVNSEFGITTDNTKIVQGLADFNVEAAQSTDNLRVRFGESQQLALFTPSVDVQATKVGEIVLATEFTIFADVEAYTNAQATLDSAFTVTAQIDGITRPADAAIAAEFQQTVNGGYLIEAQANITDVFAATVNVEYFEGTALLAPMSATMTTAAVKIARSTTVISSAFATSATGFNAVHDPGPVSVLKPYSLYHFDTLSGGYFRDEYDNTRAFPATRETATVKFGTGALSSPTAVGSGNVGWVITSPVTGNTNFTADLWYYYVDPTGSPTNYGRIIAVPNADNSNVLYEIRTYGLNGAALFINGGSVFNFSLSGWQHLALQRNGTSLTLWRDGQQLTAQTVAQVSIGNLWGLDSVKDVPTNTWYSSRGFIDELRIRNIAGYSGTFTPPTSAYGLEYDVYDEKNGYALLEAASSLTAQGISVVYIDSTTFTASATQSTVANRVRYATSTPAAATTVYANAGKQVSAQAQLSATFTQSTQAQRSRDTAAGLTAAATVVTANTRLRYADSTLNAAFAQSANIRVITDTAAEFNSSFAQITNDVRVRYADADFEAFYTEVAVVAKNATGTVTLESAASLSATANKTADEPHYLSAEFAQVSDLDRIRYADSQLTATVDVDVDAERVQPAGSEMSAEFTQTVNTNNSKIVGFSVAITAEFQQSTSAERFRDAVSLEVSAATLTCDNDVLRLANADLNAAFTILASPTFIVRIEADFIAFNTQLTVGDVINIDPFYQLTVPQETRLGTVLPESRIITVDEETRVNIIQGYTL